ncbi:alkaline phosphatase family protein [Halosimplex salinum]|uniref:hypothetical protein n=1 Tax=Halosimplex salinum TaxID=1710538 RepID=UPI0013DD9E87|nr:hypothetical protein [Halosimplex salinum]
MTTTLQTVAFGLYHRVPYNVGRPVFETDWDVLVVLDACRPDALEAAGREREWISHVPTEVSVGSNSEEWISRNFREARPETLDHTGYVTGNPYSAEQVPRERIAHLDEVWRYAWDDDAGTMPPRPITDRAIAAARDDRLDRLVVHYMQPHFPSIPSQLGSGKETGEWGEGRVTLWERIESGAIDVATAWEAYLENLEFVLEEVELLLDNVDADDVVVTADHGEAFGEWGLYGHGHQPAPILRRVPWIQTTARDSHRHEPAEYDGRSQNVTRDEQLRALGYR